MRQQLRLILEETARAGALVGYRQLAERLQLQPPQTIRRVALLLEALMEEDMAAGRPFVAALCVSRINGQLPRRDFFLKAAALGAFAGDPEGALAKIFHQRQRQQLAELYARPSPAPGTGHQQLPGV